MKHLPLLTLSMLILSNVCSLAEEARETRDDSHSEAQSEFIRLLTDANNAIHATCGRDRSLESAAERKALCRLVRELFLDAKETKPASGEPKPEMPLFVIRVCARTAPDVSLAYLQYWSDRVDAWVSMPSGRRYFVMPKEPAPKWLTDEKEGFSNTPSGVR